MAPLGALAQQCEYPIADLSMCEKRTPRAGHVPTVSSPPCGPEWFPDGVKFPQGAGEASFVEACTTHDVCYETCNSDKAKCDDDFAGALRAECFKTYPRPPSGVDDDEWDHRGVCLSRARAYANAVKKQGQRAYDDAQKKACECCRRGWTYLDATPLGEIKGTKCDGVDGEWTVQGDQVLAGQVTLTTLWNTTINEQTLVGTYKYESIQKAGPTLTTGNSIGNARVVTNVDGSAVMTLDPQPIALKVTFMGQTTNTQLPARGWTHLWLPAGAGVCP